MIEAFLFFISNIYRRRGPIRVQRFFAERYSFRATALFIASSLEPYTKVTLPSRIRPLISLTSPGLASSSLKYLDLNSAHFPGS